MKKIAAESLSDSWGNLVNVYPQLASKIGLF
jgi:hypothetical protein